MHSEKHQVLRWAVLAVSLMATAWLASEFTKAPPASGDWQPQYRIPSTAEFRGGRVTVRNIRNFRYYPEEEDTHPGYYSKEYDLSKIRRVWYTAAPFNENGLAAHTYLSFEFEGGEFLAVTIEARKTRNQSYSPWKGMLRTYPLIYIAADERDVTLMRANTRREKVYVYPVKLEDPRIAGILFTNMLTDMNSLLVNPRWYHSLFHNCTSEIARHVNRIAPGKVSIFSWQLWMTASADELALKHGLLDTRLPVDRMREKYFVTEKSLKSGDVPGYSRLIREQ